MAGTPVSLFCARWSADRGDRSPCRPLQLNSAQVSKMTSDCSGMQNLNTNGKDEEDTGADQKENKFIEPHKKAIKTPLKQQSSTSHSVMGGIRPELGAMTTPTKLQETPVGEPWTPTANLKMLSSAASPEIRSREKKRELIMDEDHTSETVDNLQNQLTGEEFHPSRKEKSLGLLCYRFLARYPEYPNPAVNNDICLDEVAAELSVERRRIYDIVNVLESLHMVSRLAKNRYTWHGRHNLTHTLGTLKNVGEDQKYAEQMLHIKKKGFELPETHIKEPLREQNSANKNEMQPKEMYFVELPGMEFRAASVNGRKDKSLRVMSQKFIMLFLVSKPRVVSLDTAAKILIGDDQKMDLDHSKFKTKIRRLYDIANVLTSLELIKKVHVTEMRGRKPAFKWIGPEAFPDINDVRPITPTTSTANVTPLSKMSKETFAKNLFPASTTKQNFTRHASLNHLMPNLENDQRKISSAPSSPVGKIYGDWDKPGLYLSKMDKLAKICKLQLEAQSSSSPTSKNASKPTTSPSKPSSSQEKLKLDKPPGLVEPTPCNGVNSLFPQVKPTFHSLGEFPLIHRQCSSVLPVMLPHCHTGGSCMIYLQTAQPSHLTAPLSGIAVKFVPLATDRQVSSPNDSKSRFHISKRTAEMCADASGTQYEDQSNKAAKQEQCLKPRDLNEVQRFKEVANQESQPAVETVSLRDQSPNNDQLFEIHQMKLKARKALTASLVSPRALHLDPEFINASDDKSLGSEKLEHSIECFFENEEKGGIVLSEGQTSKVKSLPLAIALPAHLHSLPETVMTSGYLIPLSQQSSYSNSSDRSPETKDNSVSSPKQQLYHSPLSGITSTMTSDFSPANLPASHIPPVKVPCAMAVSSSVGSFPGHSPSPGILNFTLQNRGLINPGMHFSMNQGPSMTTASPEQAGSLTGHTTLQQGKMIFVKPVSPLHQPVALINVPQPKLRQSITSNRKNFRGLFTVPDQLLLVVSCIFTNLSVLK
ncbi:transcription factor E2F8 isoform X2 [Narcine bancroftii]|uniref:transcription factor E2F8 isoform X2 n=1 Tax=Narcine bancroftii TaxID=1343680 RepID=UPI003831A248